MVICSGRHGFTGFLVLGGVFLCAIPNKSNRVVIHRFNKRAYKGRNVIERCFCRLKDFRRIATRYDKLARNFLAAVLEIVVGASRQ